MYDSVIFLSLQKKDGERKRENFKLSYIFWLLNHPSIICKELRIYVGPINDLKVAVTFLIIKYSDLIK